MSKFRKKPVVIEATQWFRNGDHPEDDVRLLTLENGEEFFSEGKVVRRFRNPDFEGDDICPLCGKKFHIHGWIDTSEGGFNVCPGDWIITGGKGEKYPCKPDIFEQIYEPPDKKGENDE